MGWYAAMPFALRIHRPRPDLSRVTGVQGPLPAPALSRLAFWRGVRLGFISAIIVFDFFLLDGATFARVGYGLCCALWFVGHAVRG